MVVAVYMRITEILQLNRKPFLGILLLLGPFLDVKMLIVSDTLAFLLMCLL